MKSSIKIVCMGAVLLFVSGAYANDGIAHVGTGGIELLKTDDIQMVSEVLEISTTQIKVSYRFLNTSKSDIKTTVAFPMPAFSNAAERSENDHQMTDFKLFVNGVQMPANMHRVFRIKGVDVTDQLRKIGLSEQQIFDSKFYCFSEPTSLIVHCRLTPEQSAAIKKLGNEEDGDSEIQETAYWEMVFPAGKEIEVAHEYRPFTGLVYQPSSVIDRSQVNGLFKNGAACMDDKALQGITKMYQKGEAMPNLWIGDVEYILGTGRNWKGPIKDFKLILKKDMPEQRVSLCFPGKPMKTSPVTIEFTQKNFVPQDKLYVIFYHWGERLDQSK